MPKKFAMYAIIPGNEKYEQAILRERPLYTRPYEVRDDFQRDYTRILFSKSYRRLKHKTQVFFAVDNDHICTRQEHVQLVSSIASTIGDYLGLNTHLIEAIALGHDLGHAPFGHGGEKILNEISTAYGLGPFHHEQNALYLVSRVESLLDEAHQATPLNLTYATCDGIVCHCGELNQRYIQPRSNAIPLTSITTPGMVEPYTYCGCVVKMSDKIAYLSRDIEDALNLHLISKNDVDKLLQELQSIDPSLKGLDNGHLIHYFINDLCLYSNPDDGIGFSQKAFEVMGRVMQFNYKSIYLSRRLKMFDDYVSLMIHQIFDLLLTIENLDDYQSIYPNLIQYFKQWLDTHKDLYDPTSKVDYAKAILDYISSMTDTFILKVYQELVSF